MGNLRFKSKPKKKTVVTRKQMRKDKRQQKKVAKTSYYQKSKEFHLKSKQAKKGGDKKVKKDFEGKPAENDGDDDDEEIPSDFEDGPSETPPPKQKQQQRPQISQIEKDRIAEISEREDYDNELKRKRLEQLEEQNENEDKIIRRYEKLLKINKRKSKKDIGFDDGLDYALELCTPESIQKMYAAAKDAAADQNGSEDEFKEDMDIAMGKKPSKKKTESTVNGKKKSPSVEDRNKQAKEKRHQNKLKEIEQKYFGDEIDLDGGDSLAGSDSEFEEDAEGNDSASDASDSGEDVLEEPIKSSKKKKASFEKPIEEPPSKKSKSQKEKLVSDSDNSDFDLLESEDDGDSDDDGSDEDFSDDDDSNDNSEAENVMAQLKKRKEAKNVEVTRNDNESDSDAEANSVWEQLKNRKKSAVTEKYVPPHARKAAQPDAEEDSDPEANSVWEQLKNRKKNATTERYVPPHARKAAVDAEPPAEVDSDPEANSVWEQLKNRRKIKSTVEDSGTREDIYGRKRDKQGNVVEEKSDKYVPPHVRARLEAETSDDPKRTEKLQRLQKLLKGQLNRLAETNLHRIANDIDNLYMQNARFDMNNTITNLILDAIVLENLSPDRMVLEHTLLIAILHANVGSEVGAHFLQILVEKFNEMFQKLAQYNIENKELDNVILIICHLYTFQIFHHSLIYEILNKLSAELTEKSVECILLVLRSIGFVLRKDNPLGLKEFILKIQKSAATAPDELKNDARVKYMLETLMAIKNNNMTKIPQFDPSLVEHFRKLLKGMITNGKYVTTMNITMEDLLNADQRGKWWLVGSAWTGNDKKDDQSDQSTTKNGAAGSEFSQKLLDLARKQRMNTDDRRSVFCIIMSAEDYIDAFEKIVQLSIKDQRTIVTVIIHCCLSEKEFNPYYAVLSQKFCDHDRKYILAIQYALWDRLRELTTLTKVQIKNLAQFIIYLISNGGQPLSVLKVIEFGELDKVTLRLVRQIMLGLLLGKEEVCEQVFERIAPSFKLNSFKDSIRLFLHHFLLKGSDQSAISGEQMKLLKKRVQLADKSLQTSDSRIKF